MKRYVLTTGQPLAKEGEGNSAKRNGIIVDWLAGWITSWGGRMNRAPRLQFWEIGKSEGRGFESGLRRFRTLVESNQ